MNNYPKLTKREKEVKNFVFQGFTNKQIAKRLSISQHTVKAHVNNLLSKFEVKGRTELMLWELLTISNEIEKLYKFTKSMKGV